MNIKIIFTDKWKLFILVSFVSLTILHVFLNWYWLNVCAVEGCENSFRDGLLAPIYNLSLYLPILLLPFLVLPVHYFRSWLLKIASWTFPVALILILSESPHNSSILALGRDGMVILMFYVIANLTFVFLLYTYAKNHEKYKKFSGYWFFLLLSVTLYLSYSFLGWIL